MPLLFTSILIGIGLSMDAFSLSILYGTLNLNKKKIYALSLIVGIFHFFMPICGYFVGDTFLSSIIPDPEKMIGVIFFVLAVQMMISIRKEEQVSNLTGLFSLLLFGFTVSIDSFSVGLGIGTLNQPILISAILFSLISAIFTFLGLSIGASLSKRFGKVATIFGSLILLGLSIHYFFI